MFETLSAVLLLVAFLVPGYIWRVVESRLVYIDKGLEWNTLALGLLTRSTLIYLPLAPFLYEAWKENNHIHYPLWTSIGLLILILILPALLGLLSGKAAQNRWPVHIIQYLKLDVFEQHHVPTAWDALFTNLQPSWVIVTLRNDKQIKGYLGSQSHISSDTKDRDIYISHLLTPDQSGFVKQTKGIYIKSQEISTIELIADEQETQSHE